MSAALAVAAPPRLYKDKWPQAERDQRDRACGHPPAERSAKRLSSRRQADRRSEQHKQYSGTVIPKHVRHCSGTGSRDWAIYTWNRSSPELVTRAPYMCNSWRCIVCRRHEAAVTYARTVAAFERIQSHRGCGGQLVARKLDGKVEARDFVGMGPACYDCPKCGELLAQPDFYEPTRLGFFVLTLDRDGWYSGSPWPNERAAYAALSAMARKFMKRVNRLAEKEGVEPPGNRWVATVEAHKTGWPHYQLSLYLPPEWAAELPTEQGFREDWSATSDELRAHAMAVGWGRVSSFERARDAGAALGYLIGTAGKHEASIGELAKITQLPTNAPARFRRLRAGKCFLPPRFKGKATGTLIRRLRCDDGTFQAEALHELKDSQARHVAGQCCYKEEAVWAAERGFGALLKPELLALHPELKAQLFPKLKSFSIPNPRGPPVSRTCAPVSLAPGSQGSRGQIFPAKQLGGAIHPAQLSFRMFARQ